MQEYSQGEIRFNLLAICQDQRVKLNQRLRELESSGASAAEIAAVREQLVSEERRRETWAEENARRKHNYVPFVVGLLNVLARKGKLEQLVETGQDKARAARERARAHRQKKQ